MQSTRTRHLFHPSDDLSAGITVGLVTVALGSAYGVLSGFGATAGLLSTGLFAIVTAVLSSTRRQISGLTAPVAAVSAIALASLPAIADAGGVSLVSLSRWVVLLAGMWLLLFGVLGVGRLVWLVPKVVISGFLDAVALIVAGSQLKRLTGIGTEQLSGNALQNGVLALGTFAALMAVYRYQDHLDHIRGVRIPWTFVIMVVTSGIAIGLGLDVATIGQAVIPAKEVFASIGTVPEPLPWQHLWALLPLAFQIAVMVSIDTLLTARLMDYATGEETDARRELCSQSAATILAGFLALPPGAQSMTRSSLLLLEGARSRLAAMVAGAVLLVQPLLFPNLLSQVPMAVFSGILLRVAVSIFDWQPLRVYLGQLSHAFRSGQSLSRWFKNHANDPIYVSTSEMLLIFATALLGASWSMNGAVIAGSVTFAVLQRLGVPMNDLLPNDETSTIQHLGPPVSRSERSRASDQIG